MHECTIISSVTDTFACCILMQTNSEISKDITCILLLKWAEIEAKAHSYMLQTNIQFESADIERWAANVNTLSAVKHVKCRQFPLDHA